MINMFGSLMGDMDDEFGMNNPMGLMSNMNMQMRSMDRLMNSIMPSPFGGMMSPFDNVMQQHNALIEHGGNNQQLAMGGLFGFPSMPNLNRLMSADLAGNGGASFCSSSVMTMSTGPDGRPQIYQATSSTKAGPNGVRETRKTVQDSRSGIKKMAIGHHIGERAHIIEKEQDLRSGQLEERQEYINLDEEEADDFNREFTVRAGGRGGVRVPGRAAIGPPPSHVTIETLDDDDEGVDTATGRRQLPALPAPTAQHSSHHSDNDDNKRATNATATSTTTTSSSMHAANIDNNNNKYISSLQQRQLLPRNQLTGATQRRPIRSSPATVTSPHAIAKLNGGYNIIHHRPSSVQHPHPYNANNATSSRRRNRTKQAAATTRSNNSNKKSETKK